MSLDREGPATRMMRRQLRPPDPWGNLGKLLPWALLGAVVVYAVREWLL